MSTEYNELVREYKINESQIKKLLERNKAIGTVIQQVNKLSGKQKPVTVARNYPGPINEIAKAIMDLMEDGRERNIAKIGTRVLGHVPTGSEPKMISNYCRGLINKGVLRRTGRGRFRSASVPSKPKSANIGADTRVKQVPVQNTEGVQ
jgi:ribosomal protein S28E/S33